jgi:hypothetical protein
MNITSAKCLADLIVHLFKRSPSASAKPIGKIRGFYHLGNDGATLPHLNPDRR